MKKTYPRCEVWQFNYGWAAWMITADRRFARSRISKIGDFATQAKALRAAHYAVRVARNKATR